jgi:hypothetical protein
MNGRTQQAVEKIFAGRPEAERLFRQACAFIESIGPVEVVARKTQVAFGRKRRFAWVWLPQMWIKRAPDKSITLTFGLRRRVKDRRIKESVEPYPGRFTHHVVIRRAADFDAHDLAG